MSNPFSNHISLNASQYLSNKANISKIKTLSCKKQKSLNNSINIYNNKLIRAPGHSALIDFTKGFYLTKTHCNNIRNKADDITDGRYTYFDFDKIKIRNDGLDKCDYIPNYEFDQCRVLNGQIVPLADINPKYKSKIFKMHTKMNIKCSECDKGPKNNEVSPSIHNIGCSVCHNHNFPTNTKDINYRHKHTDFSKNSHGPYPHINRYATNQYYIARKYNPIPVNISKRFTLKPKLKLRKKNVRSPYMGKDKNGVTFSSKLKCNCKQLRQCNCS